MAGIKGQIIASSSIMQQFAQERYRQAPMIVALVNMCADDPRDAGK